ncbi:MAG: anaerobic ribonucleoside-triphosphate reductase activating protein [Oscillospiraceae bacterium]
MNYGQIKTCDIANGVGVRVTLFVSGCTNHCYNCFQPQTWDFHYGQPFDAAAEQIIFNELEKPFIRGLTLLGGDPFEPENQRALVPFLHRVRERYPDKDIWAFSGFELDKELTVDGAHPRCEVTDEMLSLIDILVDGRYVDAQRNLSLRFRGSENQPHHRHEPHPRGGAHRTLGGHERMEVKIQKLRPGAVTRGAAARTRRAMISMPARRTGRASRSRRTRRP